MHIHCHPKKDYMQLNTAPPLALPTHTNTDCNQHLDHARAPSLLTCPQGLPQHSQHGNTRAQQKLQQDSIMRPIRASPSRLRMCVCVCSVRVCRYARVSTWANRNMCVALCIHVSEDTRTPDSAHVHACQIRTVQFQMRGYDQRECKHPHTHLHLLIMRMVRLSKNRSACVCVYLHPRMVSTYEQEVPSRPVNGLTKHTPISCETA